VEPEVSVPPFSIKQRGARRLQDNYFCVREVLSCSNVFFGFKEE
jgi:hypothetical protein